MVSMLVKGEISCKKAVFNFEKAFQKEKKNHQKKPSKAQGFLSSPKAQSFHRLSGKKTPTNPKTNKQKKIHSLREAGRYSSGTLFKLHDCN